MCSPVAKQLGIPFDDFLDFRLPLRVQLDHFLKVIQGRIIVLQSHVGPTPIKVSARITIVQADGNIVRCDGLLILALGVIISAL